MTANEAAIRKAYRVAEDKDVAGFINCFTASGTFTDESIGVTYRGQDIGRTVEIYATAFPDMHWELYRFYEDGDTVNRRNWPFKELTRVRWCCHLAPYHGLVNAWMRRAVTSFASRTARSSL